MVNDFYYAGFSDNTPIALREQCNFMSTSLHLASVIKSVVIDCQRVFTNTRTKNSR